MSQSPKRIPAPILTRWWTVGVAAEFLLDHWDIIELIVHGSIQCRTTDKAVNQIASGVQALMNNGQIKSDVHLINAFHKHFLSPHFAFLQKGDEKIGGTPGFLNRHIAGHYFLMHSDLNVASQGGWQELNAYQGFVASLQNLSQEEKDQQEKKCNFFNRHSTKACEKHFDIWANKLLFLSLFAEAPIASVVARYLAGKSQTLVQSASNDNAFDSPQHDRIVDLTKFSLFITNRCKTRDTILLSNHVATNIGIIQQLANAADYSIGSKGDIWCDECSILSKQFRYLYQQSYATLPSSTHIAESNVKDANYCQIKGRGEALASAFSTARSDLVEPINRLAKFEFGKKEKYMGNGRVSGGIKEARTRKIDNTNFEEATADSRIQAMRGCIKTREAIKYISSRHHSIQQSLRETPAKLAIWNSIHKNVAEKENQFATHRVAIKVDEYEKHKHNNKPRPGLDMT